MIDYQLDRKEFVRKIKEIKGSKVENVIVKCGEINGFPLDCVFEIVFDNGIILKLDLIGYPDEWEIRLEEV